MMTESVGSFLPSEELFDARKKAEAGIIDSGVLSAIVDAAVRDIVEQQINVGLPFITSGELRRKHWAKDFWFGLDGISCEKVESGSVYQPVEAATELLHITGRIAFNPGHPFFDDFKFLHSAVGGRARCRQTLPSPANLLLEIYALSDGKPESLYPASTDTLIDDIARAYRSTILHLHSLGCAAVQFDDTACGLMCDDNYTTRLLLGGVDLLALHKQILKVINDSISDLPEDIETSIYISGGDKVVPEWEYIEYPDNIMPAALSTIAVDKFFLPFETGYDYALEVLRHVPAGKTVVLGVEEAHTPFPDNKSAINHIIELAKKHIASDNLALSPKTGFKLSSWSTRGLTWEDQWKKLAALSALPC